MDTCALLADVGVAAIVHPPQGAVCEGRHRGCGARPAARDYDGQPPRKKEHRVFSIKTFRIVALAEATSFLALLTCSFAARDGVPILGPIHGMLFLAYVFVALTIREAAGWTTKQTLLVLVGAVLPFGGFVVDRWLAKTGQLEAA
jgi:integral membrane protein